MLKARKHRPERMRYDRIMYRPCQWGADTIEFMGTSVIGEVSDAALSMRLNDFHLFPVVPSDHFGLFATFKYTGTT